MPREQDFTSRLRSPAVSARIGLWLGICFLVAFLTGLYSHAAQLADPWLPLPTRPSWTYRVSQGLHVSAGTAGVPLLLVKLWAVYPKLFVRPPRPGRDLLLHALERGSIGVLVAAAIFQLASGLANAGQWYSWAFSFRATHYAVGWLAAGSLLVHVAVKLPLIRQALRGGVEDEQVPSAEADRAVHGLSRRGLLRTTYLAAALAVVSTAGGTVPALRRISVFAVRSGEGPGGVPINKTAAAADVTAAATAADYVLTVVHGDRSTTWTRAQLEDLPQHTATLPIACVEGWSATGTWTGVRVRDLVALVGAPPGSAVLVTSLQPSGPFRQTRLPANFVSDGDTLLALRLAGEPLSLDHGYPCRVIAPNRPGVLQTKWVSRLETET